MKKFGTPAERNTEEFEFCGETFTARFNVTGGLLLRLSAAHSDGTMAQIYASYSDVLDACIIEDDQERFAKLMDTTSTIQDLAEVVGWLIEQSSERPTQLPSLSQPGPETTGNGATEAPPSQAATS